MNLLYNIIKLIASYLVKSLQMKLLDWIKKDKLDWLYLCLNPNAILVIENKYKFFGIKMMSGCVYQQIQMQFIY